MTGIVAVAVAPAAACILRWRAAKVSSLLLGRRESKNSVVVDVEKFRLRTGFPQYRIQLLGLVTIDFVKMVGLAQG